MIEKNKLKIKDLLDSPYEFRVTGLKVNVSKYMYTLWPIRYGSKVNSANGSRMTISDLDEHFTDC